VNKSYKLRSNIHQRLGSKEIDMTRRLTLIIVPLSTLNQWQEEISRFTGGKLRVFCWHGEDVPEKRDFDADSYDIVVTTYDTCANDILFKAKRTKKKKGRKTKRNNGERFLNQKNL
jgi:SNF2 family DNA or RNA helicase